MSFCWFLINTSGRWQYTISSSISNRSRWWWLYSWNGCRMELRVRRSWDRSCMLFLRIESLINCQVLPGCVVHSFLQSFLPPNKCSFLFPLTAFSFILLNLLLHLLFIPPCISDL